MKWTIARARERFSQLLREAASEPQPIYNRERLVAAVIGAESLEEYLGVLSRRKEPTLAESFEDLRAVLGEESYELLVPARGDREIVFPASVSASDGGRS